MSRFAFDTREPFTRSAARTGLGRRQLLMALGAGAALTTSRRLLGEGPPPAQRLVIVMQNNGTQQANFWPRPGFSPSPILQPILGDPALARRTAIVRGIQIPRDTAGTDGNEHDMGFARMLTGARLLAVGGHPWGGARSVDQTIARAWGTDSLTLAVLASAVEAHPKPGFQHRRSCSYVAPGTHKLPTLNPFDAYRRLFAFDAATTEEQKQRLIARRSALDAVRGDLADLQNRLGPQQRAKLEVNAASVRQLESSISRALEGQHCSIATAAPRDYGATPELLTTSEAAIPELIDVMSSLMTTAMGCGLTRVATLQLGYGGGKWRFAWEGIDINAHDDIAHLDTSDEGSSAENTDRLVKINRFYATVVANIAKKLDAIPEADGSTALDHTLVVWANELGRGDHNLDNVPLVLIGGAGCGVRTGGRFIDEGVQPFQRVGCTLLRAAGIDAQGFGDDPACGALSGL